MPFFKQHDQWSKLTHVLVGQCYAPEFFEYIENPSVRQVFQQIARETEEDFQTLITKLESFGINCYRPNVGVNPDDYIVPWLDKVKIMPPPMAPCDHITMVGEKCVLDSNYTRRRYWKDVYADPDTNLDFGQLPDTFDKLTAEQQTALFHAGADYFWQNQLDMIRRAGNEIINVPDISSALSYKIGKDMVHGLNSNKTNVKKLLAKYDAALPDYRHKIEYTDGHADGVYCPVKPGLIISLDDILSYEDNYPGWEIITARRQDNTNAAIGNFMKLAAKNQGKWWMPGQELNDDFTFFVNEWMDHWTGYVMETGFEPNMMVLDEKNVVTVAYNETIFNALAQRGITTHIVNFRHRFFWDAGLHCITSDLRRDGELVDYFPK